jgi:hypothetical protein
MPCRGRREVRWPIRSGAHMPRAASNSDSPCVPSVRVSFGLLHAARISPAPASLHACVTPPVYTTENRGPDEAPPPSSVMCADVRLGLGSAAPGKNPSPKPRSGSGWRGGGGATSGMVKERVVNRGAYLLCREARRLACIHTPSGRRLSGHGHTSRYSRSHTRYTHTHTHTHWPSWFTVRDKART